MNITGQLVEGTIVPIN